MNRTSLTLLALALLLASGCERDAEGSDPDRPFGAVDDAVEALLSRYDVPGAAVAIVDRGRLVHLRGYGTADAAQTVPTADDALFRIASVSKTITAVALHRLFEQGHAHPDDRLLPLLGLDAPGDARWARVTLDDLLRHRGGLDRDLSGDIVFDNRIIAEALGLDRPAEAVDIARYALARPLDFEPGARFAYSNTGYALLGLAIEGITDERYADYVMQSVLAPMGIERMQPARSRLDARHPDEVHYHPRPDRDLSVSVFPGGGLVPHPDGGFYIESMTALGGWVASAADLARLLVHVDGDDRVPDLLDRATREAMLAPLPDDGERSWYARGWFVQPLGGDALFYHQGILSGSRAFLFGEPDGRHWVALFNRWPRGDFSTDVVTELRSAIEAVDDWPARDLFEQAP